MELTLREIADSVGGDVIGDDKTVITGINSLDEASCGEISFFSDPRYRDSVKKQKPLLSSSPKSLTSIRDLRWWFPIRL